MKQVVEQYSHLFRIGGFLLTLMISVIAWSAKDVVSGVREDVSIIDVTHKSTQNRVQALEIRVSILEQRHDQIIALLQSIDKKQDRFQEKFDDYDENIRRFYEQYELKRK